MALGRQGERQGDLVVMWKEMPRSPGHIFYDRLTPASVAAELGVTPTQLKTWRLELEAAGSASAIERQQAEAGELDAAAPGQQTPPSLRANRG